MECYNFFFFHFHFIYINDYRQLLLHPTLIDNPQEMVQSHSKRQKIFESIRIRRPLSTAREANDLRDPENKPELLFSAASSLVPSILPSISLPPLVSQFFYRLGTMTILCCPDRDGIIGEGLPEAEEIFFLKGLIHFLGVSWVSWVSWVLSPTIYLSSSFFLFSVYFSFKKYTNVFTKNDPQIM